MTANTLTEFWRIIRAYWFIGNDKFQNFVRQVILTVLIGGGALMFVSLLGIPALTALVALALIVGVPARMFWQFKYPLIVPIGAVALPKIDEDAWELVKEVVWRATQALTLFGLVALYFSSPFSPFLKLSILERLSLAPVFVLAFVVAGLCYLVGWRQQSGIILALTAASSLLIRVGGLEGATAKLDQLGKTIEHVERGSAPASSRTTTAPRVESGTQSEPPSHEPPVVNATVERAAHKAPAPRPVQQIHLHETVKVKIAADAESPWLALPSELGQPWLIRPDGRHGDANAVTVTSTGKALAMGANGGRVDLYEQDPSHILSSVAVAVPTFYIKNLTGAEIEVTITVK